MMRNDHDSSLMQKPKHQVVINIAVLSSTNHVSGVTATYIHYSHTAPHYMFSFVCKSHPYHMCCISLHDCQQVAFPHVSLQTYCQSVYNGHCAHIYIYIYSTLYIHIYLCYDCMTIVLMICIHMEMTNIYIYIYIYTQRSSVV